MLENKTNTITALIAFNKALQQQYIPSQSQYTKLEKTLVEAIKIQEINEVAFSNAKNALAHAYMCGFTKGKDKEREELMAEFGKPLV